MALAANMAFSENDVGAATLTDYGTLVGDDPTTTVTLPFSVTLDEVTYTSLFISMNGWVEFGAGPGFSDFSNDCLPTSAHPGPMVAAYWDDLTGTLEFGYTGTAPNRAFIVSYDTTTLSGGFVVDFQIQIHETSGLINVKYFDLDPSAVGQSATLGFQLAGAAAARTYPIVCNGTVLDDDSGEAGATVDPSAEGWSIVPVR
jgi:hypothetical protein